MRLRSLRRLCNKKSVTVCILLFIGLYVFSPSVPTERVRKPCDIRPLDPWDKSLKPFLVKPKPLVCSKRKPLMFVNNTGYLHFNTSRIQEYSISSLTCVYNIVVRELGDSEVTFKPDVPFIPPVFIDARVFRVICKNITSKTVYDYLHFNAYWNESQIREDEISNEQIDQPSIIIVGIDSVSRAHALRNLPKSYEYLRKELGVYDFVGYSKVGENTWPNLVPMLTGRSYRQFPLVGTLRFHCDSLPLLWFEKGIKKYVTSFSEDRPDISTFNFIKSGFRHIPTDYYFRPYTLAMNKFEPIIVEPLGKADFDCFGSSNYFDHQIAYLRSFMSKYRNKLKFVYFWNNQVGHEDFTTLSRGDEPFLAFLKWMNEMNHTQNAIFAVLSDHGFRIGGASLTHAGRAENNKPLLLLHVPKQIKQKYPWVHEALDANTQRLVSHYDTYQTFLDLIRGKTFKQNTPKTVELQLVRRNLFSPIPVDRTCADAGIEEKFCACNEKMMISTKSDLVREIALKVVKSINTILSKSQDKCAKLSLHNITEATVAYSNIDDGNVPKPKDTSGQSAIFSFSKDVDRTGRYVVTVYTVPGYAYFEGTIDFAEVSPDGTRHVLTTIGEPSRLDRYGNQSHCMNDSFLKLYCYCNDLVV